MSNEKESSKKEICEGCLSSGRKLLPIHKYMHIYQNVMEDFLRDNGLDKTAISKVPLMCWECRSFLRNTQKFQKRAIQSYEILQMKLNVNSSENIDMNLSTLASIISTAPDYVMDYDSKPKEYEIQITKEIETFKVNEKKEQNIYQLTPNEINFKVETDDTNTNYDNVVKIEVDEYDAIDDNANEGTEFGLDDTTGPCLEDTIAPGLEDSELAIPEEIKNEFNASLKQMMYDKRNKTRREKFKVIPLSDLNYPKFDDLCKIAKITDEERKQCEEKLRHRKTYVSSKLKCEKCILGYSNKKRYKRHMQRRHSKSNKFECDTCGYRVKTKQALAAHVGVHGYKYACSLCGYEGLKKHQMTLHFSLAHQQTVECRECGLRFNYREFYRHYREMHKTFICDYCGRKCGSKQRLINHIRIRHSEHICQYCNRKYMKHHSLVRHVQLLHTKLATEESYCVECDVQFDNVPQYRNHLKMSVKHRPKVGIPCPECGKLYAKNIVMKNHYAHVHLKKTKFYCELCCRYFLNGFRLRQHTASFHQKIEAPRNKICMHCGRGFRTNRILDNHIRTHTGERPFACAHCNASFAQKSALVSHARSIHKVMLRYAETPGA